MINFEELRIKDSEVLGKEQWNGLLDETSRYLEGNVGLGTDAPTAKLHIAGQGGMNVDLLVNGRMRSDNDHGGLWVSGDRFVGGAGAGQIGFYNNGAWRLLVENTGNVQVSGNLRCGDLRAGVAQFDRAKSILGEFVTITSQSAIIGGGLTANRIDSSGVRTTTLHATSLRNIGDQKNVQYNASTGEIGYDNSSRRDKQNIRPLEEDFGKIMQLQPRKYTRPNDPEKWEIGYIAEEAKSLGLDPLIFYDADNNPDGINYRKLCLYLVEIVREHESKLNPGSPHLVKYIDNEEANLF